MIAGKASLDDDVRKYLDGSYPKLEFEGEPVRLLHLANMTSALPDNIPDLSALEPDPGRAKHARAMTAYTKAQFLEALRGVSPRGKPGADVAHSNAAAQLLAYALERIYGVPYETLLAREIEGPLGVTAGVAATGYDSEGRETAVLPRKSFGYRYSTADMLRYATLQLDEKDPAVALSHKGSWFTLDRKTWVGLTWISTELPGGGRQLRYSGGTWGFASVMLLYPERRLGVVVLANNAQRHRAGQAIRHRDSRSGHAGTALSADALPMAATSAMRAGHGTSCRFHPDRRFRQPGDPADRAPRARGGGLFRDRARSPPPPRRSRG